MTRRAAELDFGSIWAAIGEIEGHDDPTTAALLDATGAMLSRYGMRRWSMDDVAEQAGIGRATLYRRFAGRDDLVRATLARDAHRFFAAITAAVAGAPTIPDKVVEGFLVGVSALRSSLIPSLLEGDPGGAMSLLADGPLVAMARQSLVAHYEALSGQALAGPERTEAEWVAEALVRLGLTFVLMPNSAIDLDDEASARPAIERLLRPLLSGT